MNIIVVAPDGGPCGGLVVVGCVVVMVCGVSDWKLLATARVSAHMQAQTGWGGCTRVRMECNSKICNLLPRLGAHKTAWLVAHTACVEHRIEIVLPVYQQNQCSRKTPRDAFMYNAYALALHFTFKYGWRAHISTSDYSRTPRV